MLAPKEDDRMLNEDLYPSNNDDEYQVALDTTLENTTVYLKKKMNLNNTERLADKKIKGKCMLIGWGNQEICKVGLEQL